MTALSFQNRLMLRHCYGVLLVRAITESGEPFFHYLMAHPNNIRKLERDQVRGKVLDFEDYGEILLSGWGENPPAEYNFIVSEYLQTGEAY